MTAEQSTGAAPGSLVSPRGGASSPILRTEGLTVRFGGLTALNDVNVEV